MLNSADFWIGAVISAFVSLFLGYIFSRIGFCIKQRKERKSQNIAFKNDNFARETIKYRFKDVIDKVNTANCGPSNKVSYSDMTTHYPYTDILTSYHFDSHEDKHIFEEWKQSIKRYKTTEDFIINAPFIDVEHYFYFYLLDHFNKGKNSKTLIDPYFIRKKNELAKDWNAGHEYSKTQRLLDIAIKIENAQGDEEWGEILNELLKENLSANSTDLSQMFWEKFSEVEDVLDNKDIFWESYVCNMRNAKRINILVDNFGIELLADIILGYYFVLRKGKQSSIEIVYHVNKLPIFVSDTYISDPDKCPSNISRNDINLLMHTLKSLANEGKNVRYIELLDRIGNIINSKFVFSPNIFWNMPFKYGDLFTNKYKSLNNCNLDKTIFTGTDLLIIKGDLNYRRLVGDKNYWPGKDISSLVKYVTAPVLIIRSFKSNVTLLGRNYKKFIRTNPEEDWQSNGRKGIIQFLNNSK